MGPSPLIQRHIEFWSSSPAPCYHLHFGVLREAGPRVMFRFYGCIRVFTPFHPELDPGLLPWCLWTLRFSLRGSGYRTAPCFLDALQ